MRHRRAGASDFGRTGATEQGRAVISSGVSNDFERKVFSKAHSSSDCERPVASEAPSSSDFERTMASKACSSRDFERPVAAKHIRAALSSEPNRFLEFYRLGALARSPGRRVS